MCIARQYYECLLPEETGPVLKYLCALKDKSEQRAEAKMYADATLQRCISATDAQLLLRLVLAGLCVAGLNRAGCDLTTHAT